jgi:hypothetical protein
MPLAVLPHSGQYNVQFLFFKGESSFFDGVFDVLEINIKTVQAPLSSG